MTAILDPFSPACLSLYNLYLAESGETQCFLFFNVALQSCMFHQALCFKEICGCRQQGNYQGLVAMFLRPLTALHGLRKTSKNCIQDCKLKHYHARKNYTYISNPETLYAPCTCGMRLQ